MASTDKTLSNLSAWISLAALAGLVVIPLFFAHEDVPPKPPAAKPPAANAPAHPPPSPPQAAQAPPAPPATTAKPATPAAPTATAPAPAPPNSAAANAPGATSSPPPTEVWSDAEQATGLRDCLRLLAPLALEIDLDTPMRHGQCGTPAPLLVRSVGDTEKVVFDPAPEMNCRLAANVARWVETVLQPIAKEILKSRIVKIVGASSYACRNIYNSPNLPLSEHATGNAVDVVGFVTADGRTITVKHGWGATERDIVAAKKKAVETAAKAAKTRGDVAETESTTKSEPAPEDAKKAAAAKEKANLHRAGLKPVAEASAATLPATNVAASTTIEATFLKRLHHGACSVFATVLGPEANEAHRDHFHLDMKDRKGPGICH